MTSVLGFSTNQQQLLLAILGPKVRDRSFSDLTTRQLCMLFWLYSGPPRCQTTVRFLAQKFGTSKPVVTRALNTLEAMGLVRRVKDEDDLRNIFVEAVLQPND